MHHLLRKKRDRILAFIMFTSISLAVVFASFELRKLSFEDTFIPPPAQASKFEPTAPSGHRLYGFAWNNNTGWISFNSWDCDPTNEGKTGGTFSGLPAGCPSGGAIQDYGVTYDVGNERLEGFAWSENLGWIAFEEMGRCSGASPESDKYCTASNDGMCGVSCNMSDPREEAPDYDFNTGCTTCDIVRNCTACLDFEATPSTQLKGWAKILNMDDDGWIMLGGSSTVSQVEVKLDNGEFKGWAWNANTNGSGIGWISFNTDDCNHSGGFYDGTPSGCPSPVPAPIAVQDYSVKNTNITPEVRLLSIIPQNAIDICSSGGDVRFFDLTFKYFDYDTNPMLKFIVDVPAAASCEIVIDLSSPNCDFFGTGDCSYRVDRSVCPSLNYNMINSEVGIKVVDSENATSSRETALFTTEPTDYPNAQFTWSPYNTPSIGEEVLFTREGNLNNPGNDCAGDDCWEWVFEGGTADKHKGATTTAIFGDILPWIATSTFTNTASLSCSTSTDFGTIKDRLPTWIEKN